MHWQSTRGISRLMFIISLLVALVVGATLSYVWTMGYYASQEYKLPRNPHITIEDVVFSAQNMSLFKVTVLNPSYSRSNVIVSQMVVSTDDDTLRDVEASPSLPYTLKAGSSITLAGFWNWANHTGQTAKISVYAADPSSGAAVIVEIP